MNGSHELMVGSQKPTVSSWSQKDSSEELMVSSQEPTVIGDDGQYEGDGSLLTVDHMFQY